MDLERRVDARPEFGGRAGEQVGYRAAACPEPAQADRMQGRAAGHRLLVAVHHPIPSQIRTHDGRPAWSPTALRTWHNQRNRAAGREPD